MKFPLNHDLHVHTNLSACCHGVGPEAADIISHALQHGYDMVCTTDHMWDSSIPGASEWYLTQNQDHVRRNLPLPQADGLRVLFGCETEFLGGQHLAISRQAFDYFDFVVIPVNHFHLTRPEGCTSVQQVAELYMRRFEELIRLDLPWTKVGIAHMTTHLTFHEPVDAHFQVYPLLPEERLREVLRFLAVKGAGIELNAGCFRPGWEQFYEENLRMYRLAKAAGCKFYGCSDAHSVERLAGIQKSLPAVVDILGLTANDRFVPS